MAENQCLFLFRIFFRKINKYLPANTLSNYNFNLLRILHFRISGFTTVFIFFYLSTTFRSERVEYELIKGFFDSKLILIYG